MQLNAFLPFRLARLAARLTASISEIYGVRYGLSRDEWRVLTATGAAQTQPTRAIAEQTGLDKVAISRAASRLEERRLIWRGADRADRRIKNLSLTREGAAALDEIERLARERESWLLEPLSAEERETLERLLTRLAERAEQTPPLPAEVAPRGAAAGSGQRGASTGRHALAPV